MKKLNLETLGVEPAELLTREQMRSLTGGSGCGDRLIDCGGGHYARPSCSNSACTVTDSGVYCGSTPYTNREICQAAGF